MPKVKVPLYQPDVAPNAQSFVGNSIFCGWLLARSSHKVLSPYESLSEAHTIQRTSSQLRGRKESVFPQNKLLTTCRKLCKPVSAVF